MDVDDNADLRFAALQEIADVSTDAVIIYGLHDKKLLYSNAAAFELLGLHKDATLSDIESIFESIAPGDKEYVRNQYSNVTKKRVTAEVEFRLTARKDHDVFICCNAYLVAGGSAIVVYIRDITRAREHEDYLVEFGARKNTLLDTLMHHMNGALNLMRHLATEAGKYVQSTNDRNLTVYLKLLNDNNTHCLEIIKDLMKEEHEQSPHISVKGSKIDIIERVAIVHDELQQSFRDRKFLFEHSVDSLYVNTDVVKLLQVVNNFTSNAIKFSPVNEPILISVSESAQEVTVRVKDQGIGIPEAYQALIFERQPGFGRTGLNGEKSLGLGLFICKRLMALLNGKIGFESKEGKGSTFYFSIPKN